MLIFCVIERTITQNWYVMVLTRRSLDLWKCRGPMKDQNDETLKKRSRHSKVMFVLSKKYLTQVVMYGSDLPNLFWAMPKPNFVLAQFLISGSDFLLFVEWLLILRDLCFVCLCGFRVEYLTLVAFSLGSNLASYLLVLLWVVLLGLRDKLGPEVT